MSCVISPTALSSSRWRTLCRRKRGRHEPPAAVSLISVCGLLEEVLHLLRRIVQVRSQRRQGVEIALGIRVIDPMYAFT